MSRLSLRLFGSPEVRFGERMLAFRTRKALALLVYLAVEGGQQTRERLSTLLWPESDAALGRASLRNTLGYLHTALGAADPAAHYLVVSRDALGFDQQSPYDSDLMALQRATAALRAGDLPRDALVARLGEAAAAYRGDFLAGFSLDDAPEFDDWAMLQRETWHQRSADIFDRLAGLLADGGETARAIEAARRWVAIDRLNEAAHRRLIALHLAVGDRAAALRAYEACRATLDDELGIAPEPATVAIIERARASVIAAPNAAVVPGPATDTPLVALSAVPLVGRAAEFAALVAAFESARRGRAGVVTLEGEPGIGKSRLARDFLARAEGQGASLLSGQGFETGGRLPYQPVIDALRRRNAGVPFAGLVSERWLAELSRLLPELREQEPSLSLPAGDEAVAQTRLFEAVAELGRALAVSGGLVLHLDDLQWADAATLDLLAYLARRWSEDSVPALLLLGLRAEGLTLADGARPALGEWLAGVARTIPLTRLPLVPLSADATAQLVAVLSVDGGRWTVDSAGGRSHRPPSTVHRPQFTEWLFAETRGQPFYLLETLKALIASGMVAARRRPEGGWLFDFSGVTPAVTGGPGLVPPGVRELIQSQLQRLAPPAFALVVAGAVLGHGFDFLQLCRVAGLDEDAALLALDQVLAARLLREADASDGTYAFAHDRIRDVTYTEAGEARRRVFHRRALAALEEARAPSAELARHATAAGLALPALRHMVAAGEAAMRLFAVRDAIAHFTAACDALAMLGAGALPFEQRVALYLQLARGHELLGDVSRASASYEDLIALAREAGALATEWAALQRLLPLLNLAGQGDLRESIERVEAARRQAEARDDRALLAEIEWSEAQLAFYNIEPLASGAHAERALALARAGGRRELIARCLNALQLATVMSGDSRESLVYGEEALGLFVALGDRALESDTRGSIATANLYLGRVRESVGAARQAVAISRAIDNPWGEVWGGAHLTRALLDSGDYGEATEVAVRALAIAREREHPLMIAFAGTAAGAAHRACFALDEAVAAHREAVEAEAKLITRPYCDVIYGELAADYALLGDWSAAYAAARDALNTRRYSFYTYGGLVRWYEIEALLRGGEGDAVETDLNRFAAALGDHRRHLVPLYRARAVVATWRGDEDGALANLVAADRLAAEIGLPGERWSILAALAAQHRRRGEMALADGLVVEARELIERLAATLSGAAQRRFLAGAHGMVGEK